MRQEIMASGAWYGVPDKIIAPAKRLPAKCRIILRRHGLYVLNEIDVVKPGGGFLHRAQRSINRRSASASSSGWRRGGLYGDATAVFQRSSRGMLLASTTHQ